MKITTRIIASILSVLVVTAVFLPMQTQKAQAADDYLKGNIKVTVMNKGYGVEWIYALRDAYEKKYPGCTVNLNEESVDSTFMGKLTSTVNDNDIVVSTGSLFTYQYEGYLVDLTDLYKEVQEGYELSAEDRMNPSFKEFYQDKDGHYYALPWVLGFWGLCYNKTVLDATLGADSYTLPRTSGELTEICARLAEKGVAPFIMSTQTPYWSPYMTNMYCQYMGTEAYYKFYEGYYVKDGMWTQTSNDTFEEYVDSQIGVKKSAEVVYELLTENKFAHPQSTKIDFQISQAMFCGRDNGSGIKSAFMMNGDFMYLETMETILETHNDIRMMKYPIVSSIVETLEDKNMPETTLRNLITAIDMGATSYAGVSAKDFQRVKQARNLVNGNGDCHVMAIPKLKNSETKYDLSKQFLRFFLSKEGQDIYTEAQGGYITPFNTDAKKGYSNFVDSVLSSIGDIKQFELLSVQDYPTYYIAGLDPISGYYEGKCLSENEANRQNPEEYFQYCKESVVIKKGQILPLITGESATYEHVDNLLAWMFIILGIVIVLLIVFVVLTKRKEAKLNPQKADSGKKQEKSDE